MNKNEFLSALAKKLSVLNDSEKEDIISEYTDTINEKVKNGMNEKEAVKDFGDIDDLAKEILKAYKINPDYEKSSESFSQKSEAAIKRGAGKIADFSRRLASKFKNANELSLELVFEIVIKIFLVLIGLSILGMCFDCLCDIGEGLLGHSFTSPYSEILVTIWYLFIFSIFVLLGVMLVVTVFKKYFEVGPKTSNKSLNTKKENNKPVKKGTTIGDVLILIVKIFVIVWIIIPLMFMDLFALIGLILAIVYLIQGLDLLGLILIMIGIASVITYLIILLFKLILNKTKLSIIPLIVSIVFIIVGGVMFTFSVMSIDYYDKAPKGIKMDTLTETLDIKENARIHYNNFYNRNQDIKKITDNTFKDGEIKLDITYNKDCYNVSVDEEVIKEDCDDGTCTLDVVHYININAYAIDDIKSAKVAYKLFIDNLKDKKVYNYHKIFTGNLKITANEATLAKIAINNY